MAHGIGSGEVAFGGAAAAGPVAFPGARSD